MDPELRKLLAAAHAAGASDDQLGQLIDKWHADHATPPAGPQAPLPTPHFVGESTRALPTDYSREGDLAKLGQGVAANVTNLVTQIPGSMAAASGIRSLVRREPYRQAYADLAAAKQGIPKPIRYAEDAVGMAPLALIPGSPALVGAGVAAADQLADANPDRGVKSRLAGAAIAAPVGAALGKGTDMLATRVRSALGKTLGAQQVAREGELTSMDNTLYGDARAESRAAGMKVNVTPTMNAALQDPHIQGYLKIALQAPQNAKATPGEVLMHAYRLMTRDAQSIGDRIAAKGEFDAALDTKLKQIAFSKQKLGDAIAEISPSYPVANAMHATLKGEMRTMQNGSDLANRVFQAKHVPGKKLGTQATEVFNRDAASLLPNEKKAAAEGVLGRLKEYPMAARAHVLGTTVPVPFPSRATRAAPDLLRTIGAPNQSMVDFLTKLGVVNALPSPQ